MRHKKKSDFMLGLDEAGRGPWAGPMTASVVILRTDTVLKTVKDSKKMNLESREDAIDEIWNKAAYYKTGHVTSEEIDTKGIANAWHDLTSGLLRDAYKMFPDVPGVVDGSVRVRGFNDVVALPKADNIIWRRLQRRCWPSIGRRVTWNLTMRSTRSMVSESTMGTGQQII